MTHIGFYGKHCLSNFSDHPIVVDGDIYPTVEHYFQSMKFPNSKIGNIIRNASSPDQAQQLAKEYKDDRRNDWSKVKENIMLFALQVKVKTHPDVREFLLATGNATLVEESPIDEYWGIGPSGCGQNRMGNLWMQIRNTQMLTYK
jgi:ribA/ribD-fused uncharacterized protein